MPDSNARQDELRRHYDRAYFERYETRTTLGARAGERPLFYRYWTRFLGRRFSRQASILEVGAGGGYFQQRLRGSFHCFAMDISLDAAKLVRQRVAEVCALCGDAGKLPFTSNGFDAVVAFDVIEHLPSPEAFLREACRVLKREGLIILSTPNPRSLGARLKQQAGTAASQWSDNMQVWHGWRDPTHVNIRSAQRWRETLCSVGLHIERDGTDFWWDTPYFNHAPRYLEKTIGNGINHLVNASVGFLPWFLGENYFAIARRQDGRTT